MVRADRSDRVDVSRAADPGHFCSKPLGKLHGKRAHAPRCAVDQDPLSRLNLPLVPKTLERRDRRDGYGRRLLERDAGGLVHDSSFLANADVLGERSVSDTEDLVTGLKLLDVAADFFDRSGEVDAQ